MTKDIIAHMEKRQRQLLIHSYLYYELNINLISDSDFDRIAFDLYACINTYPEEFKETVYCAGFKGFDGSSGFDLPYRLPEIVSKATQLLQYHNSLK